MPQSQISHELVSHQKCHNAQMAGNSPDLNPIENLRTLIKKKFLHQIRQLWMS